MDNPIFKDLDTIQATILREHLLTLPSWRRIDVYTMLGKAVAKRDQRIKELEHPQLMFRTTGEMGQ